LVIIDDGVEHDVSRAGRSRARDPNTLRALSANSCPGGNVRELLAGRRWSAPPMAAPKLGHSMGADEQGVSVGAVFHAVLREKRMRRA